jgi:hypothetical protein
MGACPQFRVLASLPHTWNVQWATRSVVGPRRRSCTPPQIYHALLWQTVVVQKNANLLDWKENYAE